MPCTLQDTTAAAAAEAYQAVAVDGRAGTADPHRMGEVVDAQQVVQASPLFGGGARAQMAASAEMPGLRDADGGWARIRC